MAEFVEARNTGQRPALVGDKYIYPNETKSVLRVHYEASKSKGNSLTIVGELPEEESQTKDDFTVITGIGKKRQGDLYEAGILTYQALLETTPAELVEKLGVTAEQVEAWQKEIEGQRGEAEGG